MKNLAVLILAGLVLVAAHPMALSTSPAIKTPPSVIRANFLALINRPHIPFDAQHHETKPPYRNLITERLSIAVERRANGTVERIPMLVVKAEKTTGRLPVVLVCHGTGGRKEGMWTWLEQLAHRGFLAVAIDGRFHGERNNDQPNTTAYNEAIYKAFHARPEFQTHPFYYDTCFDLMRTIDYLITRDDADPERIGMIGTSKGGIETYLTAAADQRVRVVVPAIAMQSFRWGLDHDRWQARANTAKLAHEMVAADLHQSGVTSETCRIMWAKIIPGIRDDYDGPSMVRLLAGRPTLILNGELDPNCPIRGAEQAFEAARAAFHEADADDRLKIMIAPGVGHTITSEQHMAALEWCVTWLKPTTPPTTARYFFRKAHPTGSMAARKKPDDSNPGRSQFRPHHPNPARRSMSAAPVIASDPSASLSNRSGR